MNGFIFAILAQALAQSPGNGISKSTYSCNDPIPVKEFLYKYFPVATPGDECTNDICTCEATSSSAEWYIQQGRVYVKRTNYEKSEKIKKIHFARSELPALFAKPLPAEVGDGRRPRMVVSWPMY